MPKGFDKCVLDGGRVRTIAVKGSPNKYMRVCYDKAGKSHAGEVKTKKASELFLKNLIPLVEIPGKAFKEAKTEIEVLAEGEWKHPQYGMIKITEEDIDKFINSFDDNVRMVDIAVDQEHMPEKGAAGWYKSLRKVVENGKTKLKATIEWTKLGQNLIKDGVFKYFSPEFDFDYEDLETHENFENVLLGGALTNRPYFKSLAPVAFNENLYAGFTSDLNKKGGEKEMTKKELKAKLVEDSEFKLDEKASDKEKKLFEEVKAEIAKEAEDAKKLKEEEDAKKKKALALKKKKGKKMSEKFISEASHTKQMNEMKSKLGVVEKKLRFKEVAAEVKGFVFSESNPEGVLLPKNSDKAVELMMAATPKVVKLFQELMAEIPAVSLKLFREEGSGDEGEGTGSEKVQAEAKKLMEKEKGLTYGDAVKRLQNEKPELFPKEE
ncbi:MAG: hypothetical protein KAS32_18855 [Candidatus Peribacteraceae bacterium]|nr:hypothetical protein [Candidatus Peribacteraceae bacterium]